MRHGTFSAAIGAAVLSFSSAYASPAQGVVSGIYVLDEKRSDNAFKAIDSAIADLPVAKRPLARMWLRKSVAVNRMRISVTGNRVGVTYDAKAPIVVWIGEDPVKWTLIEGLVFDVSAYADGDAVSLSFRGDDSDRVTTYRSDGQDLAVDTILTVPSLSKPITYKQVFNQTN